MVHVPSASSVAVKFGSARSLHKYDGFNEYFLLTAEDLQLVVNLYIFVFKI